MIKKIISMRRQKNNRKEVPIDISYDSKINHCSIGRYSYIGRGCDIFKASIGRYCSIAQGVKVISGFHPTSSFVSTHPIFYNNSHLVLKNMGAIVADRTYFNEFKFSEDSRYITIGSDVWIGADATILAGVTIGHGAIIATGAVVVKDVLPYQIVGGVPAKEIKYRFSKAEIEFLLNDKWWEKSHNYIVDNYMKFHDVKSYRRFVRSEDDL
jgi:acetyltransferase-like isoleucine patch superfamily enzyme